MMMNTRQPWRLSAVALLFAPAMFAATVSMTLTSAGGNISNGVYVNPYTASINGVSTQVICDDYVDDSYIGESWTADVHTLSDLTNTRWGSQPGLYNEAAWLSIQLLGTSDAATRAAISFAIWGVFVGQAITDFGGPSSAAQTWLNNAASHAQDHFDNVLIYTPNTSYPITCDGHACANTPPQEFLVVRTPEAPAAAFLGLNLAALGALVLFIRRRSFQSPALRA